MRKGKKHKMKTLEQLDQEAVEKEIAFMRDRNARVHDPAGCPACGQPRAYNALVGGSTDCMNPDCWRCWMGPTMMSMKGILARIQKELDANVGYRVEQNYIVISRSMARRLIELGNQE